MASCSLCGKEELLFNCHYCGSSFCSEHRLPESHGCPGILRARDDARTKLADSFSGYYDYDDDEEVPQFVTTSGPPRTRRRRKRFSTAERRDLLIASVLVCLVGFSMLGSTSRHYIGIIGAIEALPNYILSGSIWYIFALILIFLTSFMIHEMAHKFTAQQYGMWSEFRMTTAGYYLSAVAIIFAVPIFGTGVVYASGAKSMEENGKVNMAGPLSNLIFGSILATISIIIPLSIGGIVTSADGVLIWLVMHMLRFGVILNAMLGLFNMIPLQPFDGGTIFAWSRRLWLILLVALMATVIYGYIFVQVLSV